MMFFRTLLIAQYLNVSHYCARMFRNREEMLYQMKVTLTPDASEGTGDVPWTLVDSDGEEVSNIDNAGYRRTAVISLHHSMAMLQNFLSAFFFRTKIRATVGTTSRRTTL